MCNPFDRTLWTFFPTLGLFVDCEKPFHPSLPKPQILLPSLWSTMQILLKFSRGVGWGNYFKYQKANFLNILFKSLLPLQIFFSSPLHQLLLSFGKSDPASASSPSLWWSKATARRTVTKTEGCQQLNNQKLLFPKFMLLVGVRKGFPSLENSMLPGTIWISRHTTKVS